MNGYQFHPVCLSFPAYPPDVFSKRLDGYRSHPEWARETTVLLAQDESDGEWKIADGRHHYLACQELGYECVFHRFVGTPAELAETVLFRNAHRRHCDPSQIAAAIVSVMTWARGGDRGNQHTGGKTAQAVLPPQEDVAKQSGISSDTLSRANKVAAKAPELLGAVKEGKLDVKTAAKVADLPKKKREKVAKAEDPKAAAKEELDRASAKVVMPAASDAWGIPVQPHAAEAFAAVPKFKELLAAIQAAARLFNEVANLPGGKFLTLPDVSSYRRGKRLEDGTHADRFVHDGLERAAQQVRNATPAHTVCPWHYADAPHPAECPTCRGLNWTPPLSDNIPPVCVERAKAAHGVAGEGRSDV